MSITVKDGNGALATIPTLDVVVAALASLATDADVQAGVAKMEAVRALLAAALTIQGTVTANLGTLNGAATEATLGLVRALLAGVLTISGTAAVGSLPDNPPLSISGVDAGGLKRHLLTDTTGAQVVLQTPDQDPVYDHANGKKLSITASALVVTPPAGCKYMRISCDTDVVLNTAGSAAVDDGTSIRLVAGQPEVIPVVGGVGVYALSISGSAATVRATPMKVRS